MNKIVQLTEYEYQQLKKEAEMTCAAMEAEIARGIEEHSKLSIDLKLDIGRDWEDVFHIKPVVYVSSSYYDTGKDSIRSNTQFLTKPAVKSKVISKSGWKNKSAKDTNSTSIP